MSESMRPKSNLAAVLKQFSRPHRRDEGGEYEGVAEHPDELMGLNASMHILCKDTADLLIKHYPGFLWAVEPDQRGGIINIKILNFHDQYGYTIRVLELQEDPKRREVVKAGAELLRRFHYPGTRYRTDLANGVPRGPDGRAIPDVSDMPPSKMKAQAEAELALAEGRGTVVKIGDETFLHVRPK